MLRNLERDVRQREIQVVVGTTEHLGHPLLELSRADQQPLVHRGRSIVGWRRLWSGR